MSNPNLAAKNIKNFTISIMIGFLFSFFLFVTVVSIIYLVHKWNTSQKHVGYHLVQPKQLKHNIKELKIEIVSQRNNINNLNKIVEKQDERINKLESTIEEYCNNITSPERQKLSVKKKLLSFFNLCFKR